MKMDGVDILSDRLKRLEEVSWDFQGARSRSPFSNLHFHPARFISQVPSILISRLSEPGDVVLDPFCGSGTTLVEAQRLSRRAIGCDVNPVSVMISKSKTLLLSAEKAYEILSELPKSILHSRHSGHVDVPETVQLKKWYSPAVAELISIMYKNVISTENEEARLLKYFCFSSILLGACRETRHWGYVCDNTQPKENPHRDVLALLDNAISEIVAAFTVKEHDPSVPALVFETDAGSIAEKIDENTVDLVITSPPYEGVVDYAKAQRLTMEWMGLDVEQYRTRETGARSKRHRRSSLSQFGEELRQSFQSIHRVMKHGAACVVVFGVSPNRGFSFDDLQAVFADVNFELRSEYVRDVSVQRTFRPSVMKERLYVLTKPLIY